jgi:hypothetical protein
VLLGLAIWILVHRIRQRRERAADTAVEGRLPMSFHPREGHAPLLHSMYTTSPTAPPLSPYADSHSSGSGSPRTSPPSEFHFPILSADGHLLPPAPASASASIHARDADRPLPAPPTPVVGLWPEHLSVRPDSPRSAASTPKLSPGLAYLEPQSAVFHRSFSSEGQYYEQDIGVRR